MTKTRKILLIDDNPLQEMLTLRLVKKFRTGPFTLEFVGSYEAGLKEMLSNKYAVCLLDYHLGDRNGLELLRAARVGGSEIPAIMLTAQDSEEVDNEALEAGAVDFLPKVTLTAAELERSIRYALKLNETLSQLRQLAQRDELTRLFNRREFQRILAEEWERYRRFDRPFSLVMIDLDHFKQINDTHGHQAGDEVLRHVASLLAGQVRSVDRVARYGGEEFALIMIETDRKTAIENIKRLGVLLVEAPCVIGKNQLTLAVTLSAGVACSRDDAQNPEELIASADKALYAAKKSGRNRIVGADGTVVLFQNK